MRKLLFCVLLILSMVSIGSVSAESTGQVPNYIQVRPLTEVVRTSVGPVRSGVQELYLITWGGDIATIHANGDSTTTTPGSIFDSQGLNFRLVREDNFATQVENFISGRSPYLRGTMGMINMANEVLSRDSRTKPVVIYQMTWSLGDMLVVKENIKTAADLCGKTIAIQAYGPHVDFMLGIVNDACGNVSGVNLKWTPDLVGFDDDTPGAALVADPSVDAAFVISPDASALTSGGGVGEGGEDSVRGARILISTKSASRLISDVYAVRSDYFESNTEEVGSFVHGLMLGEESIRPLFQQKSGSNYQAMVRASARILLDSEQAVGDLEGLYADCEYVSYAGNTQFFADSSYQRRFGVLNSEIQSSLVGLGLLSTAGNLAQANFNYDDLKQGLTRTTVAETSRFNPEAVNRVVGRRAETGALDNSEVFSFEINFGPNQTTFSANLYQEEFDRAIDLAARYGGAIITVEGHSDPMNYLRRRHDGDEAVVLSRIKQSAKNLSFSRATSVRDELITYASDKGISLDPNQFASVGHGIMNPRTGMCGDVPCAPETESQWLSNMRVEFRIITIEAEASAFTPIGR